MSDYYRTNYSSVSEMKKIAYNTVGGRCSTSMQKSSDVVNFLKRKRSAREQFISRKGISPEADKSKISKDSTLRTLFTNFLSPGLTCDLCNTLHDWLKPTSATNHPAGYIIGELTRELKSW